MRARRLHFKSSPMCKHTFGDERLQFLRVPPAAVRDCAIVFACGCVKIIAPEKSSGLFDQRDFFPFISFGQFGIGKDFSENRLNANGCLIDRESLVH